MIKYICKIFEDLKDGESVLSFGVHMLRWNFDLWGDPDYAFVPEPKEEIEDNVVATAVDEKTTACDRCDTFENPSCNNCLGV